MKNVVFLALLATATWIASSLHLVAALGASPSQPTGTQVTFNRDVAPIIFHSCARCHRSGESGPFALMTYEDVKKHARQIEIVTGTRFMPPWLPDPQRLKFAD